jgi:hypothetical protein
MEIVTYFNKSSKVWVAYALDDNGNQIGHCSDHVNKQMAIFWLGVELAEERNKFQFQ